MDTLDYVIGLIGLIAVGGVAAFVGLVRPKRRGRSLPPRPAEQQGRPLLGRGTTAEEDTPLPGVGDDAEFPRDSPSRAVDVVDLPAEPAGPVTERPDPVLGRLVRLRERLSRSNSALGQSLLALLSRDRLDEATWEEVEETLLLADVGIGPTTEIVDSLRERVRVLGTRDPEHVRELLRQELLSAIGTDVDRSLRTTRHDERPAVILVVGVNGTGKTTTVGKLARVLVAEDKEVVLGAADTFRAAAAEQLATWGERVGVPTIRSDRDGADPAAVAFDAVKAGIEAEADVVIVDTAGRLQNKAGLMDELGKVKRVLERHGPVDEVLLVLDATTGQNGLRQAAVFSEVVDVSGIVLTKLDGTAKGGIVVAVQRTLNVPVKLVGLGEGPDDLAPFDPEAFVDALLS
ncbi:signal recognition particle-docking protein FtsY [Kineococcus rubinsiae]|uniref:signal recognition particle-docking protein FtsY n=1 Tax=Kineococcus rubinsiae TaxID=2609562 RepID=UPI0014321C8B|nr:signal recognition particle-docking protein FtsY [Kineococcus rubinsiae]NIZ93512.1 signal recognition particle-docking protein FtsY [Kineococcus rubinsiae]